MIEIYGDYPNNPENNEEIPGYEYVVTGLDFDFNSDDIAEKIDNLTVMNAELFRDGMDFDAQLYFDREHEHTFFSETDNFGRKNILLFKDVDMYSDDQGEAICSGYITDREDDIGKIYARDKQEVPTTWRTAKISGLRLGHVQEGKTQAIANMLMKLNRDEANSDRGALIFDYEADQGIAETQEIERIPGRIVRKRNPNNTVDNIFRILDKNEVKLVTITTDKKGDFVEGKIEKEN